MQQSVAGYKCQHENKFSLAAMRMMCPMSGNTRRVKVRNDSIIIERES